MKKITTLFCVILMTVVCLTGCTNLPDEYYTVDESFEGINLQYYSDSAESQNKAVDAMVYTDFPDILKKELEKKGNVINEIDVTGAEGDEYGDGDTVAVISMDIDAESGDVKSGKYYVGAYFTYERSSDYYRIYLINYTFLHNKTELEGDGGKIFDKSAELARENEQNEQ